MYLAFAQRLTALTLVMDVTAITLLTQGALNKISMDDDPGKHQYSPPAFHDLENRFTDFLI